MYPPGCSARPKPGYGPLCVFKTQERALNFIRSMYERLDFMVDGAILIAIPCEYKPTHVWHPWVLDSHGTQVIINYVAPLAGSDFATEVFLTLTPCVGEGRDDKCLCTWNVETCDRRIEGNCPRGL